MENQRMPKHPLMMLMLIYRIDEFLVGLNNFIGFVRAANIELLNKGYH